MRSGKIPTVMSDVVGHFARSPQANIPRSVFNRSHGHKTTFDAGYLVPILVDEALPGDTFHLKMTGFARMTTPIFPIMDNLYMETFFFAVPYRLVWSNWEKFNGAQDNPGDSTDFVIPQVTAPAVGGWTSGTIADYFGLPIGVNSLSQSALPFRAYNLIWNQWFRDENLQNSLTVSLGNGPDADTLYSLKRRNKRYDYFTSALPWPQKGTAVTLPLGSTAPVNRINNAPAQKIYTAGTNTLNTGVVGFDSDASALLLRHNAISANISIDPNGSWVADLSGATASTINSLRQAFQTQRLYERDARGGTRYTEIIRSHFGVISPDMRLQRAEYLGGGSSPIVVTPVPQTSSTDATTPQGNLAAIGTASLHNHSFTKSFTEHCIIIGLVNVRADLNYQQGMNRLWSRSTRFDYYWPALAHIGEQAILNKEIYCDGSANDSLVFGYQERYAEYRYKPSLITGLFRTSAAGNLDSWHLAQQFVSLPALNSTFIEENPPMTRILAVAGQPHFIFDSYFSYKCTRPMPVYSVPGLIDHF